MSKQRSSGPHRRILARLCALTLIAAMLLTSAYAGGAVESGPAVESLATENLAAENLMPQSIAPAEGAGASSAESAGATEGTASAAAAADAAEDIDATAPVDASITQAAQPSTAVESTTAAASTAPASTQSSAGITAGVSQTITPTEKPTGPARAPQNGAAPLAEEQPVYTLVLGSQQITGVTAFYPAEGLPQSTNGQWGVIGLYYDTAHDAHVLLAHQVNNTDNAESKLGNFHVNDHVFQKGSYRFALKDGDFNSVVLKDEQGASIESLNVTSLSPKGYFDVTVGDIDIGNSFSISMDGTPGGWQIEKIDVTLDLDYTITKQVTKGSSAGVGVTFAESVRVDRGDYVIYKITVANKGKLPLQNMILTDLLPQDVFVKGSIQMGVGEEDGSIADWTSFDSGIGILFDNYSSPGKFTRDVYITAQVKPDLDISTTTTYTNTATIDGMSMPTLEDRADIIVNAPEAGELRVTKTVTLENPLDTVPDTAFNFTLTYDNRKETFELKSEESRSFTIPASTEFTVTETNASGYTTKVNGSPGRIFTGTMPEGGSPVAAFENQLSAKMIMLNIKKMDAKDSNLLTGAKFALYPATVTGEGAGAVWVKTEGAAPITPTYAGGGDSTGEDGLVAFPVQLGNYLLYEMKAPSGYKLFTDPVRLTVTNDKVILYLVNGEQQEYTISNLDVTVPLSNIKQDKLPVAGGMGAIWFPAGGLALASAAALLYFKQRKKGEE